MFKLIKLVIWMVGLITVSYFGMRYFGYDINWSYFNANDSSNGAVIFFRIRATFFHMIF